MGGDLSTLLLVLGIAGPAVELAVAI